ncbi:MAG TPA: class I SAM-dependent methyltransferase [Kiritimatiellia bacterium]|jgi:hypothetical protein
MSQGWRRFAARLASRLVRPKAAEDAAIFNEWQARGIHITPANFYSPIPDTRALGPEIWTACDTPGLDLNVEKQVAFLRDTCLPFQSEYNDLPATSDDPYIFKLDNDAFSGIDPLVYYSLIRKFKPRMILEIGSGHSSLLAARATSAGSEARRIIVDPYPRYFVEQGSRGAELLRKPAEHLPLSYFEALQANDILFIDSSHAVRMGGEVNRIFLLAIPRLPPGVLVHVHDIFLPYDYPHDLVVNRLLFWSEQYLLQAYLAHNPRAEILLAHNFLERGQVDALREIFPRALYPGGVSFWFRTK